MAKPSYLNLNRYFDLGSAYGQLILLVFIPVTVLASVGSYLVLQNTSKTATYEQESKATSLLMRYESTIKVLLPQLLQTQSIADSPSVTAQTPIMAQTPDAAQISQLQAMMSEEPHLNRMAIIDESGQVISAFGINKEEPWQLNAPLDASYQGKVVGTATSSSTSYGHLIGDYRGKHYWLFVDIDNEPMYIFWLQVLLTVMVTVLISTLLLLLALTIFAKRWIVPIYNMRLHLQQTTPDNLYKPLSTHSSGELNLLQQDLVKTLRRLHSDFQELKEHAEQTENDLQLAFDEMEMRNISNRRARDMAVSTSEAKSAFLANISHELRTPLNSIDGFINLLSRHGALTAEQALYVETIRKSSAHLLALVNDVLDFSKIEAGKLVLDNHQFNLYAAIYDVMDMLSPLASEKGLSMTVLYYNDVPANITGDALRVKQIVTNLVSNAIKFTDTGSVVVRVSLDDSFDGVSDVDNTPNAIKHSVEGDGKLVSNQSLNKQSSSKQASINQPLLNQTPINQPPINQHSLTSMPSKLPPNSKIIIAVEDTGRGVDEAEQAQLFKNFSQGDPSITRQFGGTGLGLVISKQLTRLMGGEIGFYNNVTNVTNKAANNATTVTNHAASKASDNVTNNVTDNVTNNVINNVTDNVINNIHSNLTTNTTGNKTQTVKQDASVEGNQVAATTKTTKQGATFWFTIPAYIDVIDVMENDVHDIPLPTLRRFVAPQIDHDSLAYQPAYQVLIWLMNPINLRVLKAALVPLEVDVVQATSLVDALDKLKEQGSRWDWVIIDGSDNQEDMAALLKQVRLHYQGKLAIFGYQVALDAKVMTRYKAHGLYQPLDKRQLYSMMDTKLDNKETKPVSQWQDITVLAVDDHPPNLLVLKALLNELGIHVITANSGFDAIDIMSRQLAQTATPSNTQTGVGGDNQVDKVTPHIDLIFMDLQMPRMSGHEASKRIRDIENKTDARIDDTTTYRTEERSNTRLTYTPIIALSAHGLSDERDRIIASGINDYVSKPINQAQLLQILQRWLTNPDASQALLENSAQINANVQTHNASTTVTPSDTQDSLINNLPYHCASQSAHTKSDNKDTVDGNNADNCSNDSDVNHETYDKQEDTPYFSANNLGVIAADTHKKIQRLPIVDWQDALTRSANKPDLAAQLFVMLRETIDDEVNQLASAWDHQDRYQLAQIAHRILGASRYTGVPQLRAASQDFEDKCLLNVQRVTPVQFAMLQPHYDTLLMALQNLKDVELSAYPMLEQAVKTHLFSENDMTWKMI